MFKQLFCMLSILLMSHSHVFSQAIGGSQDGQSSPSEVKPSEISAGGFSGDVSLFTGAYSSNYTLGSVSTPSGLSFTANINYSSTFSSGDSPVHTSGIPYGEGWNVEIPSISVKTEDFNKYTLAELANISSGNPYQDPTPTFYNSNTANSCQEANEEGQSFWFAPTISIPGVASGRLVFKYKDGGDYVFVLHKFERYVEARLEGGGQTWKIILDDGTVYLMAPQMISYRGATNQRLDECADDINSTNGVLNSPSLQNVYDPKLEYLTWYCHKIYNTNSVGAIWFEYDSYGCFDYFQAYNTPEMERARERQFGSIDLTASPNAGYAPGNGSNGPMYKVCKEIILKEISSGAERLVLDYENIPTTGGVSMLDPNDPEVFAFDDMYSAKAIKIFEGGDISNEWFRYLHAKHPALEHSVTTDDDFSIASATNPYKASIRNGAVFGNNPFYIREAATSRYFDHGYLESPRIGALNTDSYMPSGDIYEIRSTIYSDHFGGGYGGCIFDINLATGDNSSNPHTINLPNNAGRKAIESSCYDRSRSNSVFSTFNNGIKWVTENQEITTSNFFLMPNHPTQFNGFNIQIGPSNSDIEYTKSPSSIFSNQQYEICSQAYWNQGDLSDDSYDSKLLKSGAKMPANFGIGLPWDNLQQLYAEFYSMPNFCNDGFWWNYQNSAQPHLTSAIYPNKPTNTEGIRLSNVEIIRYAKNPHMLKSVKKQVYNSGNWVDLSHLTFDYSIRQVARSTQLKTSDQPTSPIFQQPKDYRNIVTLDAIHQLPVDGGGTPLSTFFDYDTYGNAGPNQASTYQFLSNFILLSKIIDPIGKVTEITYNPLNDIFWDENNISLSGQKSYAIPVFGYRDRPNYSLPSGNSGYCTTNSGVVQAPPYTMQVFFTVAQKTVDDRAGTSKVYTYVFDEFSHHSESNTPLDDHFAWDKTYNISIGFGKTTVTGPAVVENVYKHHTDYQLWGKIYEVISKDEHGQTLSKSNTTWESVVAFEPPTNRVVRDLSGNKSDYYEYLNSVFPQKPNLEDLGFVAYNNAVYDWLNGEGADIAFDPRYDGPPNFYESNYFQYIQSVNPLYLYSFFIKKTSETQKTFDNSCPETSGDKFFETTTNYSYYDANYRGEPTSSLVYQKMGIQLNADDALTWEPSWQLASKTTTIGQLAGNSTTENYFYLYDLANHTDYQESSWLEPKSDFRQLWLAWAFKKLRSLPIETRLTKNGGGGSNTQSTYYVYDENFAITAPTGPINSVEIENPYGTWPCEEDIPGNNTPPNNCVFTNTPPAGYCAQPDLPNLFCLCTAPNPSPENASVNPENTVGNGNNGSAIGVFNYWSYLDDGTQAAAVLTLEGKILPKKIIKQVKPESNQQIISYSNGSFEPDFHGYEILTVQTILARSNWGQVALEENERGLKTEYEFSNYTMLTYPQCINGVEDIAAVYVQDHIGLPKSVTVGKGLPDALKTEYAYFENNTIEKVTDPNNMVLTYEYDGFLRLKTARRNGAKIQSVTYSNANNAGSFEGATTLNYVETFNYVEGSDGFGSKSFVDPLGRNVANINFSGSSVVVEDNVFDIYDRPVLKYKPHFGSGPTINGDPTDCIQAQFEYDTAPRGRALKSSKYGECLDGDHIVKQEYCMVTFQELQSSLALANKYSGLGCVEGTLFMKSIIIDEDDKGVMTFTNAIGQKVATITNLGSSGSINSGSIGTVFCYDEHGNVQKVNNAENQESTYTYNYLGQLINKEVPDAGASQFAYNESGQLILDNDGAGGTRGYRYDDFGRMVEQGIADGQSATYLQGNYDGNPWIDLDMSMIYGANIDKTEKEWLYDRIDDAYIQHPDIASLSIGGPKGRLVHAISYDNAGRPILMNYFSYNIDGFLAWEVSQFNRATAGQGEDLAYKISYPTYNLQGSYIEQNVDILGEGKAIDYQQYYEYDSWNRIETVFAQFGDYKNYPSISSRVASYSYDDVLGVVSKKKLYNNAWAYNDQDEQTDIMCEGVKVDEISYIYDTRERLTNIQSNFFNQALLYDDAIGSSDVPENWNGNINASLTNYSPFGPTFLNPPADVLNESNYYYEYDGLNRLVKADCSTEIYDPHTNVAFLPEKPELGDIEVEYDKIGNIKKIDRGIVFMNQETLEYNYGMTDYTFIYRPNTNQLQGVVRQGIREQGCASSYGFSYDDKGNLIGDSKKNITSVTYGRANLPFFVGKLPSCDNQNSGFFPYLYDMKDSRIFNGGEYYQRDAAGHELFIYDVNLGEYCWYVHGNERVAKICDPAPFGTHNDGGGSCSTPSPTCILNGELIQNQHINQQINFIEEIVDLTLPTTLYRLKLCDGSQRYFFAEELQGFPGNYTILQQITISDHNQEFSLTTNSGIEVVGLDDLLIHRQNEVIIDGYDPCTQEPLGCPDILNDCDPDLLQSQADAVAVVQSILSGTNINTMMIPNSLLRIRLCSGEEMYITLDLLHQIPGPPTILQQIDIPHDETVLEIDVNGQGLEEYPLAQLMEILGQPKLSINVNQYESCVNDPENCDPENMDCSTQQANYQLTQLENAKRNFAQANASIFSFPQKLYRIRLCYGDEIYLMQNELQYFSGIGSGIKIVQEIEVTSIHQLFEVEILGGGTETVDFTAFLQIRGDDKLETVNGYVSCAQITPCHPNGFSCSPEEHALQGASITALLQQMANTNISSITLPQELHYINLCDATKLYVLDSELSIIEGSFSIIQSIEISIATNSFEVYLDGQTTVLPVNEILDLRHENPSLVILYGSCQENLVEANNEYGIFAENWEYETIPDSRKVRVTYDKVVTGNGLEILRERESQDLLPPIIPFTFSNSIGLFNIDCIDYLDKLTLKTLNPNGFIEIDLNPNTVNPAILANYGYTPADLYLSSPNIKNAVDKLIRHGIDNWSSNALYGFHIITQNINPNDIFILRFDRITIDDARYVGLGSGSTLTYHKIGGYQNGQDCGEVGIYTTGANSFGNNTLIDLYITHNLSASCQVGICYRSNDIYNVSSSSFGNYVLNDNLIFDEDGCILNPWAQNSVICTDPEYPVTCVPPTFVYTDCQLNICSDEAVSPPPALTNYTQPSCCEAGNGGGGSTNTGANDETGSIARELQNEFWRVGVGNIQYPNQLHTVHFRDGQSLLLLDEELDQVAPCEREVSRTVPVSSADQRFSVSLQLNNQTMNAGVATLSNVLQLRADGADLRVEPTDRETTPPDQTEPGGGDERVVPEFSLFIYDHLGNTRLVYHNQYLNECTTDSLRYVLEHAIDYYPFGKTLREYVYQRARFQTTYHERDGGTGLDYRGARFYDADLGRFLSLDPLAAEFPEWSDYNYVLGNPIAFVDPDGKMPEPPPIAKGEKIYNNLYGYGGQTYKANDGNWYHTRIENDGPSVTFSYSGEDGWSYYGSDEFSTNTSGLGEYASGVAEMAVNMMESSMWVVGMESMVARNVAIKGSTAGMRSTTIAAKNAALNMKLSSKAAGKRFPTMTSAVKDKTTGNILVDFSGKPHPTSINKNLEKLMPAKSLEPWAVCNCAEFKAANKAMNAGSKMSNLEISTVITKNGNSATRCRNCQVTTKDAQIMTDK